MLRSPAGAAVGRASTPTPPATAPSTAQWTQVSEKPRRSSPTGRPHVADLH